MSQLTLDDIIMTSCVLCRNHAEELTHHVAKKKIPYINTEGQKLEKFICKSSLILLTNSFQGSANKSKWSENGKVCV